MRHGVPEFFRTLSDQYEIVIFTREPSTYAMPIIDKMDSEGYIWYRLYRDFTRHEKGEYYKDLTNLNRDLRRVILLDTRADASKTHPENVVVAPKWDGKSMDFWLLDLIPFLQTLASTRTTDVRPILTSYQGTDIPSAFAENQKRLEAEMELRRAQQAQQAQLQASKPQLTPPAFGGAGGSVNPWRR
ncbi:hypothetical protein H696_04103 [Fonticula alba]|uniref:Mitochondrial import inner membrane translocase subunit TIM50 n=1 Tax=Fonticula alba TaxID=691883 RepID=A0A058Z6E2_FONAL|nr:hypothetical protein H696_04103 [Fonticula alba]KCV69696.1 hypothetical protein H696_04103 [Fonticula alba]|eukprot:XP_009496261.1 hypothetical protein H696_04103 [Fonticula alba]